MPVDLSGEARPGIAQMIVSPGDLCNQASMHRIPASHAVLYELAQPLFFGL